MSRRSRILVTSLVAAGAVAALALAPQVVEHVTAAHAVAHPARVAMVGDSIMAGSGLTPEQAWPALLGHDDHLDVINLACGGAGFRAVGGGQQCSSSFKGLVAYAAATHPGTIVVQGSSNDLGQHDSALSATTTATVRDLHEAAPRAQIVGLSAVWNEHRPPAQLARIDDQVRSAVRGVGGSYVDIGNPLEGHADWMQSDDVHPNAAGQRALEHAIRSALHTAHVTL
jgi:acyl-CoA thioesterase-1